MDDILENIIRIGTVSSVNASERTARVKFESLDDMVSGPLRVLQRDGCDLKISVNEGHNHSASVTVFWMPKVGETVLCLYLPMFNGGGVILGVLK